MIKSISSRASVLLSTVCLLAAFVVSSIVARPMLAQTTQSPTSVKGGRSTEKSTERDDKSEREKRDELGRKLERRREELNSVPTNSLVPARPVKQESAPENKTSDKAKEKKPADKN